MNVRATPLDSVMASPAELMFGRPIATALPSRNPTPPKEMYRDHQQQRADAQKAYADRGTAPLRPLHIGQAVRVLNQERMCGTRPRSRQRTAHPVRTWWRQSLGTSYGETVGSSGRSPLPEGPTTHPPSCPTPVTPPHSPQRKGGVRTRSGRLVRSPDRFGQ